MSYFCKFKSLFRKKTINLSHIKVKEIMEKNKAEPWFIYIFNHRKERWDIWKPSFWVIEKLSKDIAIYETGCGCGLNLIWFGQQGIARLCGSDISKEAINAGKELVSLAKLNIELFQEDALNPSNLPQEIDVVIALNWTFLIEQFNLKFFLEKYSRTLKNNGYIIIDVIDTSYNGVLNNQYLTSDWNKPETERKPSEYKKRYSGEDISRIVSKSGFKIVETISNKQIIPKVVYIIRKINNNYENRLPNP